MNRRPLELPEEHRPTRAARASRVLGLTLLALVLIAAMTAMGLWQLGVYREHQALDSAEIAHARPVPLDSLLRPDQAFTAAADSRPVVTRGEYADRQFLVSRGSAQPWVATPLVTASGSAILVVRGLAASDAQTAPPPPHGPVHVVGSLQPSEVGGIDRDLSDDRVPSLSTASLVGDVGTDLYSGFVVLTHQTPAPTLRPAEPPAPAASFGAGLRNLMYAVQWWVFAGFVVFMWWRIVREEPRVL